MGNEERSTIGLRQQGELAESVTSEVWENDASTACASQPLAGVLTNVLLKFANSLLDYADLSPTLSSFSSISPELPPSRKHILAKLEGLLLDYSSISLVTLQSYKHNLDENQESPMTLGSAEECLRSESTSVRRTLREKCTDLFS